MITLTQETVNMVLSKLGKDSHYLGQKPIAQWDTYDLSNWYAILRKYNKLVNNK